MKSKKVNKKKLRPQDMEVKLENTTGKEKTIEASKYKRKITCRGPTVKLRVDFLVTPVKAKLKENILTLLLHSKENYHSQMRMK